MGYSSQGVRKKIRVSYDKDIASTIETFMPDSIIYQVTAIFIIK